MVIKKLSIEDWWYQEVICNCNGMLSMTCSNCDNSRICKEVKVFNIDSSGHLPGLYIAYNMYSSPAKDIIKRYYLRYLVE